MAVYMAQFSYTPEAWKALAQNPVDRREALRGLMQATGGRLIELYYSDGEYDGVSLLEFPDEASTRLGFAALAASGAFKDWKTTRLTTVEEVLQALRKAGTLSYPTPAPNR